MEGEQPHPAGRCEGTRGSASDAWRLIPPASCLLPPASGLPPPWCLLPSRLVALLVPSLWAASKMRYEYDVPKLEAIAQHSTAQQNGVPTLPYLRYQGILLLSPPLLIAVWLEDWTPAHSLRSSRLPLHALPCLPRRTIDIINSNGMGLLVSSTPAQGSDRSDVTG
ncbi:hypothetical protein CMUS01_08524 [Colletotrichum musicola]|uniref:Uncharacterized protein n=1 Tax=Colletotrichum musicola TaxID=2175873 RepID=A0A8H6KD79_9PEZI|nr:hypothetical protein CMUS01_08524 [Colletotrichum musicola]